MSAALNSAVNLPPPATATANTKPKLGEFLFHRQNDARLYCGDSLEIMPLFKKESFDLIFADPPYGLSNGGTTCHAGRRVSVNKGAWDKSRGVEADFAFHQRWLAACRDLLKPSGTLWLSGTYHSIYACGHALQSGGWHILNEICWYKPNAAPHLACRMFAASHETLIWARKSKQAKHFFEYKKMKAEKSEEDFLKKPDRQMRSVWAINTPAAREKKHGKHPTQKPETLLRRIVSACTPLGGRVLDPFCGSGTTGVAALAQKRKFVGVEIEKEYLKKYAAPRLADLGGK